MSLFQSLDTSAGGMLAQSKATSIISTNIANINTTGYKRSEAAFYDLVTTSRYSPGYEPGGVTATRILRADQQGSIQKTSSSTEAAINGNGFFVVGLTADTEPDDVSAPSNFFFTRNGAFSERVVRDFENQTEANYLANSAGQFLYGWQFDSSGQLPVTQDFSTLSAINLTTFDNIPIPTTELSISLNLNADAEDIDLHLVSGGARQLPADAEASSFTRNFTVFDSAGAPQEISFEYRKIIGPMAHFTSSSAAQQTIFDIFVPTSGGGQYSGISDGDTFDVTVGEVTETYTFVSEATGGDVANNQIATMLDLINALDEHGVDPLADPPVTEGLLDAQIDNNRLVVRAIDPTVTIELAEGTGNPLTAFQTLNIVQDPDDPADFIFEPDVDITAPEDVYPGQVDFPAIANTTDPVPQNWWELTIRNPADNSIIRQGLLNFNGDGSLNAMPDADGNFTIDLATTPIDFDGDPETAGDAITVDISRTSQFAGSFQIVNSSQNGAGIGTRTGLEITEDGRVIGIFASGVRANLYQIPLANFSNPNGLNDESGTRFSITEESGDPVLALAGQAGNGVLITSAIEDSNVDLGSEFSGLIVSQRGYSLNSQVIQAIDEMTERLGQL